MRTDAWRTMPWKNGGGITHEIWREGEGEGFDLRLSIAEVAQDGPFSRFPGVDRVITLLEGRGFRLRGDDGREVTIDTPGAPFAFSGDEAWTCELLSGPVRDFNVMSARGRPVDVVASDGEARIPGGALVLALEDGVVVAAGQGAEDGALARHELAITPGGPTRVRGRAILVTRPWATPR